MNIRLLMRTLCVALALFVTVPAYAVGEATGNIVGSLENYSGGDFTVNATHTATGRSRDVNVDASGDFRFSQLPVGAYVVSVSNNGNVIAQSQYNVALNGNTVARFEVSDGSLEEIVVTATALTGDVYSTDSGLVLSETEIDIMPVARTLTGISLLAPGVILGESKFDLSGGPGYASFGGSSIAENSCYINGLEVTNTSQGLGCGAVPFEFYQQFQVKTGGYSAQYGRSTGGVLNAVTKSGGNEWEFGIGAAIEPKSLYEEGKISRGNGALGGGQGGVGTGRVFRDTTKDENDLFEYWLTASGPIIEDRLFVYAIVNPRDEQQNFSWQAGSPSSEFNRDTEYRKIDKSGSDNLFWGAKVDWDINDYHRLSVWGYSNRSDGIDTHFAKDPVTNEISSTSNSFFIRKRGGTASSIAYTGTFMDDFTVSAMFGTIETEYTTEPDDVVRCPRVTDNRTPAPAAPFTGCGPGGQFGDNRDTNEQFRLDLEYSIGDHLVRVGLDKQDRDTFHLSSPIGGGRYTYSTLAPNSTIQGTNGVIYTNTTGAPQEIVNNRLFDNGQSGGMFTSELTAYYIEDEWQLNDNVVLYLGARKDQLTNIGGTGVVFTDFDQEWAPRVGLSWDPTGNGQDKVYSTWGRYYLPVANNTNFRVASGVSDTTTHYTYTGVDPTTGAPTGLSPVTGDLNTSTVVNSDGTAPTQAQFQAQEADPFFKEEFILGYEKYLSDEDKVSIRYVNREVGATLDDYCGPLANGTYCTLVNPGFGGTWEDTDGVTRFHPADQIKLPKGRNEYNAVQLQWDHTGERTSYSFTYSWSQSIGNFEGAVKSDIQQPDAGITQDFDFPALMDGADGYLPNDRRHVFKFFGSYQISEQLTAGWNASLASGRPLSMFGQGYPDDAADIYGAYGDTFYLFTNTCNTAGVVGPCTPANVQADKIYTFNPRGSGGRTPWLTTLDASLTYDFFVGDVDMSANLQIFNILDIQEATSINEHVEQSEGTANEWYGAAYAWQTPRYVRLSIQARF